MHALEAARHSTRFSAQFTLNSAICDASAAAVGAVLSQMQEGLKRPIAFVSRALSLTEQIYSVGKREVLLSCSHPGNIV